MYSNTFCNFQINNLFDTENFVLGTIAKIGMCERLHLKNKTLNENSDKNNVKAILTIYSTNKLFESSDFLLYAWLGECVVFLDTVQ